MIKRYDIDEISYIKLHRIRGGLVAIHNMSPDDDLKIAMQSLEECINEVINEIDAIRECHTLKDIEGRR